MKALDLSPKPEESTFNSLKFNVEKYKTQIKFKKIQKRQRLKLKSPYSGDL